MPICRPSKTSARALLALAGLLLLSASALAQDSARDRTAAEGDAALDRLKDAASARKQDATNRGPASLPTPSEDTLSRPALHGDRLPGGRQGTV